jgi:hypothetical protein
MNEMMTIEEWTNKISDKLLHHIGEYYCLETKSKTYQNKTGGYTKGFCLWFAPKFESDELVIPKTFEVLRDNNGGFFIRRK